MDQETDPCHISKMRSSTSIYDKCEPCIHEHIYAGEDMFIHCTQSQPEPARISTGSTSKAHTREYDSPEATASRNVNKLGALSKARTVKKINKKNRYDQLYVHLPVF